MTQPIMSRFLNTWDRELRLANKKVILLLDNATSHPKDLSLSNIAIEFMPTNTTSLIQV